MEILLLKGQQQQQQQLNLALKLNVFSFWLAGQFARALPPLLSKHEEHEQDRHSLSLSCAAVSQLANSWQAKKRSPAKVLQFNVPFRLPN